MEGCAKVCVRWILPNWDVNPKCSKIDGRVCKKWSYGGSHRIQTLIKYTVKVMGGYAKVWVRCQISILNVTKVMEGYAKAGFGWLLPNSDLNQICSKSHGRVFKSTSSVDRTELQFQSHQKGTAERYQNDTLFDQYLISSKQGKWVSGHYIVFVLAFFSIMRKSWSQRVVKKMRHRSAIIIVLCYWVNSGHTS